MNIARAAEYHDDRLWNRLCTEEEEAEAAEKMGMTVAELRKHNEQQAAEAAIENLEWSRDK